MSRLRLVLASSSPRRRELLERIGIRPLVRPAAIDETPLPGEDPAGLVERLARAKAEAGRNPARRAPEVRIGSDTVVVLDDEILGKPADPGDARAMLRRLSGREHDVLTGVAVHASAPPPRTVSAVVGTRVTFRDLDDEEIAAYVATGEPMDKAGSYGIQGRAAVFVPRIVGSYHNVVGLPLDAVDALLRRLGYRWLDFAEPPEDGPDGAG